MGVRARGLGIRITLKLNRFLQCLKILLFIAWMCRCCFPLDAWLTVHGLFYAYQGGCGGYTVCMYVYIYIYIYIVYIYSVYIYTEIYTQTYTNIDISIDLYTHADR